VSFTEKLLTKVGHRNVSELVMAGETCT